MSAWVIGLGLILLFLVLVLTGLVWQTDSMESSPVADFQADTTVTTMLSAGPDSFRVDNSAAFGTLALQVDFKGMQKLNRKKREAIEMGVLMVKDDDWVDGVYENGDQLVPVRMRLKGDWLDHIRGRKQSLRIRVKGEHTWNRLKTFSVQTPQARDHLSEWVYHQFLVKEGLLSTRYDFIKLTLNGEGQGVYAFEEHFDKILPEYNHRREGPIVRFSEEEVWNARHRDLSGKYPIGHTEGALGAFEASEVTPFQDGRISQDTVLKVQFEKAQRLLQGFKYGKLSPAEIFDIDKTARYFAILDVCKAWHSLVWHNQRFYFNPVIEKLEPVGFDGYTMDGVMDWINKPFLGHQVNAKRGFFLGDLFLNLFLDEKFVSSYVGYLHQYSDTASLRNFLHQLEPDIASREEFIREDFRNYRYDRDFLIKNAAAIRQIILPFDGTSVNVRSGEKSADKQQLWVSNHHSLPLLVTGFGIKDKTVRDLPENPLLLPAFDPERPPEYVPVMAPAGTEYVFYRLPGVDSLFSAPVSPFAVPGNVWAGRDNQQLEKADSSVLYRIEDGWIIFNRGEYTVREFMEIPEGYRVKFPGGVNLDFVNGAGLLSRSPVFAYGSEEFPVRITSSDQTARGFSIIQAEEQSELQYVVFDGFNTLNREGWQLTGAVTFYESPVRIERCSFLNNQCEDGLNLIRSEFEMTKTQIRNTKFDGLDADFCKGRIISCDFVDIANDGMDFSGSLIDVINCQVKGAGDKGISIGEESRVEVHSAMIANATTGVASKDLSHTHIKLIELRDCQTGFAAYRKKPEFGPAEIEVDSYQAKGVKYLHLIEKDSKLTLEGSLIRSN